MKANMGNADRMIRTIVAVALGILYFTGTITGTLATIGLVVAVIVALTSLVSFCPLYAIFGINTCPTKS